jgi:hypothetical protein
MKQVARVGEHVVKNNIWAQKGWINQGMDEFCNV